MIVWRRFDFLTIGYTLSDVQRKDVNQKFGYKSLLFYWFHDISCGLVWLFANEYPHGNKFSFTDWLPEGNFRYWPIYINSIRKHIRLLAQTSERIGLKVISRNCKELVDCIVGHQEILVWISVDLKKNSMFVLISLFSKFSFLQSANFKYK